jgi:hypothetical protein
VLNHLFLNCPVVGSFLQLLVRHAKAHETPVEAVDLRLRDPRRVRFPIN